MEAAAQLQTGVSPRPGRGVKPPPAWSQPKLRLAVEQADLAEEGRPPESIFDFVQGITALARDKAHQDARLDMEGKAKKLLDRVH